MKKAEMGSISDTLPLSAPPVIRNKWRINVPQLIVAGDQVTPSYSAWFPFKSKPFPPRPHQRFGICCCHPKYGYCEPYNTTMGGCPGDEYEADPSRCA